jgi:hypothetical protein
MPKLCQCDTIGGWGFTPKSPIRFMRLAILTFFLVGGLAAQDEYRVYGDHPLLFLTPQRLRLLQRERERDSMRWRQFSLLVQAAAQMPEPGFSLALYYAVSADGSLGRRAVDWALGPGTDLRQLALVYDWCQPLLSAAQSKTLAAKIRRLMEQRPASGMEARRDRVLAAVALGGDTQHSEEAVLRETVQDWWKAQWAPKLASGRGILPHHQIFALLEILHAIRDNLKIDLREDAAGYFKELPKFQVLGNYPAPLAAPENEYRIPVFKGAGQPDVDHAALARAAGLSNVAYDNNALENQYLQGWLIQDRFMLQGTFGAPYEFLWANPYQPGLSYFQLPILYHDAQSGALFLRSNWEDDAVWFGLYEGEAQLFRDGNITVLNRTGPLPAKPKPIAVGDASVVLGRNPLQFTLEGGIVLVVGLKARHKYLIETDDEELRESESDSVGTLVLTYAADRSAGVHIQEAGNGSDAASIGVETSGRKP